MNSKKITGKYHVIFTIVALVMAFRCCGTELSDNLIASLKISYRFGFVTKGINGSLYEFFCGMFNANSETYTSAFVFSAILMMLFVGLYILWGNLIVSKFIKNSDNANNLFLLLVFFTIWAMSLFTGEDYIGSSETIMLLLLLWEIYFILTDGKLLLLIIFPAAGIIVQSDFFFAFLGVILLLLGYAAQNKDRKKYSRAFIIVLCETIALYLYFTIMQMSIGGEYEAILDSFVGFPSLLTSVLRILIMILLIVPYIIFYIVFLKKLSKPQGLIYKVMPLGGLTIVPLFFISNNYGTWFFAVISYYVMSIFALLIMGDDRVNKSFNGIIERINKEYKWLIILLIYAVFFTPIDSIKICYFVNNFIR